MKQSEGMVNDVVRFKKATIGSPSHGSDVLFITLRRLVGNKVYLRDLEKEFRSIADQKALFYLASDLAEVERKAEKNKRMGF